MTSGTAPASTVFVHGTVWLHGVPAEGSPTALAVRGGRIVALGAEAEALAATAEEVVDLAGGALLPSFGDGHAHPVFGGLGARFAPVREATSVAQVQDAVAQWATAHPDEPWVRGDGYDPTLAPGGVFEAAWLDAVVADRPVWLRASDYHTAWVNSRALEVAGIDRATADPADGEIVRRADGTPVGTLREWGAWGPVAAAAPPISATDLADCLEEAAKHLARVGVTWVQDAWAEPDVVEAWLTAAARGRLAVRGNLALLASPETWREDLDRLVETRARVAAEGDGVVTARTVKFFADGIVEGGTGAMLDPYEPGLPCGHPHGLPNWDWADLAEAVVAVDALGFQPHLHAIGDAAIRAALDALDRADATHGRRDRRATIAHLHVVHPDDRARLAAARVIANFEPLWACPDPSVVSLVEPRLGPERSAWQYPIRTLLGPAGAPGSFGSDWPVSSADPREGLAVAVTRQLPDGTPPGGWLPEERIDVARAVEAYTRGVAHQAFEEDQWGSIAVGARADLVHLGADPRRVPALELPQVPVLGTWLAGRRTAGPD